MKFCNSKKTREEIQNYINIKDREYAGKFRKFLAEKIESESKRDFQHKIGICKKEAKETKHWIRLLAKANPNFNKEFRNLWQEAQELLLIFSSIMKSSKRKV